MPRSCLHAAIGDEAGVLVVHHKRERKAGPQISVTVLQCRTHRREIPRLVLRQATDAYACARGRAARGHVIVGVLGELGDRCLLDRVLVAGACAGCWGTVTRWDAASGGARGRVFTGCGAPAG